jgi:hypothetical protein
MATLTIKTEKIANGEYEAFCKGVLIADIIKDGYNNYAVYLEGDVMREDPIGFYRLADAKAWLLKRQNNLAAAAEAAAAVAAVEPAPAAQPEAEAADVAIEVPAEMMQAICSKIEQLKNNSQVIAKLATIKNADEAENFLIKTAIAVLSTGVEICELPAPVAQPEAVADNEFAKESTDDRIASYQNDIQILQNMLNMYAKANNLCGAFDSDMRAEIQSQIAFCENCIENLQTQAADAAYDTVRKAFAEACADAGLTAEQTAEAADCFYAPQLADEVRTEAETDALYDAAYAAAFEHMDWLLSRAESPADYTPARSA